MLCMFISMKELELLDAMYVCVNRGARVVYMLCMFVSTEELELFRCYVCLCQQMRMSCLDAMYVYVNRGARVV